ncbi:MAG: Asp-tRNA(Asn)/Glu-tRNA(Gln) amidotransferase GatCAB subunit B [Alphaproteobacteria bacterium CG11_big_fil_rev_8_21_14_0_20_39_49]|nr:MAG: Asp-tRNA(Asn)/Glu-tRNA(Gln) amidotransferase GatCAB subunit B [Alphaproteobacteria bacterium CG11_big_fil_rev_8_21_14_0_20_39_49]
MTQIIKGNTGDWEIVIGLEVHAQITSESKLFSGSSTFFGAEPNTQVSLVDTAMPGMLPVLNKECVRQAVRTGLGLKAKINLRSIFDRKNYFYADLPQGYQISQFSDPIVGEGTVVLDMKDGSTREVGVERIHIEQDAGKSMHDQSPDSSFIDLNRSGIALMEIVSKPDMRSGEEAAEYMKKLRTILRYLGTCDGDMEKGSMRCDANVSVRPVGSDELRTRCEIKNLNSVRFLQQAIAYEANRHVEVYETGGKIDQETRLFDSVKGETRTMRSKEDAHDYRYFPDPDLLPLELTEEYVQKLRDTLPELPDEKKERYVIHMGLSAYDASVIVADKTTAEYFEEVAKGHDPKLAANWVTGELFGALKKGGHDIEDSPVSATQLGGLLDLIKDNTISGKMAKEVFAIMYETGKDADAIVEEKGLKQVTDTGAIEQMIDEILDSNQDKVEQYRSGKDKLFGFFVGQTMKASQGKANPQVVNEILKKKLAA